LNRVKARTWFSLPVQNKSLWLLMTMLFLSIASTAQDIDTVDFNKKMRIVKWLVEYEEARDYGLHYANTHDGGREQLQGSKQYCFPDTSGMWHTIFVRIKNGNFELVRHYTVPGLTGIQPSSEKIDTILAKSYVQALTNAAMRIPPNNDTIHPLILNEYITKTDSNTIQVFFLPDYIANKIRHYKCDFQFTYDSTGTVLLAQGGYFKKNYHGNELKAVNLSVKLDYTDVKQPTLGALFLLWKHRGNLFAEIWTKTHVFSVNGSGWLIHKKRRAKRRDRRWKRQLRRMPRYERRVERKQ
jgi:hypothetical protein